ncbi:uncharacterized protein LOC115582628 isoform X3 [Sparus aurata]|uniref:uncharacterized protein LOC115582628 isoform X3 n=1 Tax=Sparus aurata TaxID=8175 RepID=UPI0011C14B32|nr:uncharacterized protein LOC115582628 isoform X3 [Sparus aurata]
MTELEKQQVSRWRPTVISSSDLKRRRREENQEEGGADMREENHEEGGADNKEENQEEGGADKREEQHCSSSEQMRGMHPRFSHMFSEILQESAPNNMQRSSSTTQQLDGYLSVVPIPRSDNPLAYWRNNKGCFPDLAKMARKDLSAPCTSTDSERLFSAATHILDEKRNRLHCDKAEKLLFIKKKLPLYFKK